MTKQALGYFAVIFVVAAGIVLWNLQDYEWAPPPSETGGSQQKDATPGSASPSNLGAPERDVDLGVKALDVNFEPFFEMDATEEEILHQAIGKAPEEVARYNELHVLPWNPITHFECQDTAKEVLGNNSPVTSCQAVRERPPHDYFSMNKEDVAELAYADPVAALVMGRTENAPEQQFNYYLRASALSGKPGPLLDLVYRRYAPVDGAISDAQGAKVRAKYRYVLEKLASEMGDGRAKPDAAWTLLSAVADPQEQDDVRTALHDAKKVMNSIRSSVLGTTPLKFVEAPNV